jgi:branched-chain amino acid transport system ATP-binding protein
MPPLLAIENLAVSYGTGARALHDASLEIEEGEFVALLGANGAGKTTLLRAVSALLPNHGGKIASGKVFAFGHDMRKVAGHMAARIGIGQVFEGRRILRDFTVEENLQAGGIAADIGFVKRRIAELYEAFPILAERRGHPAGLLSGGEQQILAIGRALVGDPKLLLLDEPSLGLAPIMIDQVARTIRAVRELGKTVLLVEQNARLALDLTDRAYVIQNGVTVMAAQSKELQQETVMQQFYIGFGEGTERIRHREPVQVNS